MSPKQAYGALGSRQVMERGVGGTGACCTRAILIHVVEHLPRSQYLYNNNSLTSACSTVSADAAAAIRPVSALSALCALTMVLLLLVDAD
jgi:hypothetical protein